MEEQPKEDESEPSVIARALILWGAVETISQTAALWVGGIIATWATFFVLNVSLLWLNRQWWNDWRLSVLTFDIDLTIVMVSAVGARATLQMLRSLIRYSKATEKHFEEQAKRDRALERVLRAIHQELGAIHHALNIPPERHHNRARSTR